MELGEYLLGFGGWDKGTWGLGVELGEYLSGFGGLGNLGLGVELGEYLSGYLGFRGGTWGVPFGFWGLGQGARVQTTPPPPKVAGRGLEA